jgi:hypothetical protein
MSNQGRQHGPSAPVHIVANTGNVPFNNFYAEVAFGNVAGYSHINKFGEAQNIDIADGFVDIWDGVNNANADKVYPYSDSADIDSISSSNVGDNTQTIEIQGLDGDYAEVTQDVSLNGQTRVALATPLLRVFRMLNKGFGDLAGDVYCYVNGAITGGIPDTSGDIRAIIESGVINHTRMALYTIPAGKTGVMTNFFASIDLTIAAVSTIRIYVRPFGQPFQVKHVQDVDSNGTSLFPHPFLPPKGPFIARTDIAIRMDSSVDNGGGSAGFDILLADN